MGLFPGGENQKQQEGAAVIADVHDGVVFVADGADGFQADARAVFPLPGEELSILFLNHTVKGVGNQQERHRRHQNQHPFMIENQMVIGKQPINQSSQQHHQGVQGIELLPLTGARFQIFRVGGVDAYGQLYLDGNFAGYPVDLTTDDMAALARMLYGYAMVDNLPAEYEVTINEQGEAVAEGMPEGVYLVIGLKHSDEVNDYLTEPQLVILPVWNFLW